MIRFLRFIQYSIFLLLCFLVPSGTTFCQQLTKTSKHHFLERPKDGLLESASFPQKASASQEYERKRKDESENKPKEEKKRTYALAPYKSQEHELKAFEEIQNFTRFPKRSVESAVNSWEPRGPYGFDFSGTPNLIYSGRVNSIAYSSVGGLYVATPHGGLWGPKPGYSDLQPLTDKLPTLAISSVAVHPTDYDTIFVATGDYNYLWGADSSLGIYRTFDGGVTWTRLTVSMPSNTYISKLMIATWNPNVIFASGTMGLLRSTNLGDTWSQTMSFIGNVSDFDASFDGHVMLAGVWGDGAYRSSDSGASWQRIPLPSDTAAPSNRGRISLGISRTAFTYAYIVVGRTMGASIIGIYRTETSDIITTPTWFTITPPAPRNGFMWGQQGYNNCLAVSKFDANTVYVGGGSIIKSTNGGGIWTELNMSIVHCDVHSLVTTTDNKLIAGSDGGVFVSGNNGSTWQMNVNLQLPTVEFYNIDVRERDPNLLFGAAQDNGIIKSTASNQFWNGVSCCDGLDVRMNQQTPSVVYNVDASPARRNKSTNSGGNWTRLNAGSVITDWSTNVVPDPVRPNWVYSNNRFYALFSTNGGANWDTMGNRLGINGIVPNSDGSFIYASASTLPSKLFWYNYNTSTRRWTERNLSSVFPRNKLLNRICPSMSSPYRVYALALATDRARIFWSPFLGEYWFDITGNLPDVQINDLIESPYDSRVLWIGTEKGAFHTTDRGTTWYRWNDGLPDAVKITDMEYSYYSEAGEIKDVIVAGTFGRSAHERSIDAEDLSVLLSRIRINAGVVSAQIAYTDSFIVRNRDTKPLLISTIINADSNLIITPRSYQLPPLESLIVRLTLNAGKLKQGIFSDEINLVHILDDTGAVAETTSLSFSALLEDSTKYRTFIPESLIARTAVRPKAMKSSWCFDVSPGPYGWNITQSDPTKVLIQFKNAVDAITVYDPFTSVKKVDKLGRVWQLSNGSVGFNQTISICGRNKKLNDQTIISIIWRDDLDSIVFSDSNIVAVDLDQTPTLPNAANFRKEVFTKYPFGRLSPLVIGVADPAWRKKNIAYVSFTGEGDVQGSLQPGKDGKAHTGAASCFDYYSTLKKMTGNIKRLPFTRQNNHLFAQLVALKLNIAASALGITPRGFGELRYTDPNSAYDGYLVRELIPIADTFMTYCVDSIVSDPVAIDTVITKINSAFVGPIDTVSFSKNLVLTGVRSVSDVDFLRQDPSVMPTIITPATSVELTPLTFSLSQNYPNPFNPQTSIGFRIASAGIVTIKVYNILGQEAATLLSMAEYDAGEHEVQFDGSDFASGVYFYRINLESIDENGVSTSFTDVKKMLLMK